MKSVELFAGAGGLAIGMARAGFQHEALIEWDHDACETLRLNARDGAGHAGDWNVIEGDVSTHDFAQYEGRVGVLSGGPPCQPFSMGGKHRGQSDARNMFPHAVRAVREIRPKAFLFENVKGLLRKTFANYYSYILHQLRFPDVPLRGDEEWTDHLSRLEKVATAGGHDGLAYNVVFRLLNAADHGVPQHRWRVLIVGVRADLGIDFSCPQPTHEVDALLHDQWISGAYWERHRLSKRQRPAMPASLRARVERIGELFPGTLLRPWRTVRDAIADLPKLAVGESCAKTPNHFLNPGARSYAGHTGSPLDAPGQSAQGRRSRRARRRKHPPATRRHGPLFLRPRVRPHPNLPR